MLGGTVMYLMLGQLGGQDTVPGGLPYEHLPTSESSFDKLGTPGVDHEREPTTAGSHSKLTPPSSGLTRI